MLIFLLLSQSLNIPIESGDSNVASEHNNARERNGNITISFIQPAWYDLFVLQLVRSSYARSSSGAPITTVTRLAQWPWWFKQNKQKNYKNSTLTHRPHNTKISRPLHSVRSYFIKRVIKIPIVARHCCSLRSQHFVFVWQQGAPAPGKLWESQWERRTEQQQTLEVYISMKSLSFS